MYRNLIFFVFLSVVSCGGISSSMEADLFEVTIANKEFLLSNKDLFISDGDRFDVYATNSFLNLTVLIDGEKRKKILIDSYSMQLCRFLRENQELLSEVNKIYTENQIGLTMLKNENLTIKNILGKKLFDDCVSVSQSDLHQRLKGLRNQ
jgi:hypothetical protein